MKTNTNKPDIVQAFDKYIDREYYKIIKRFLFISHVLVRSDRIKEWKEWNIECDTLPDKIYVNGVEHYLTTTPVTSQNRLRAKKTLKS